MNVVFMGTPEFAVPTLESIIKEGHHVSCVVTQPDRPKGRGKKLTFSPIKEKAIELNIKVMQPLNIKKDREFIESLKELNPDVIVVVAFGQILSKEILIIPRYGCINVHGSLLPRLRGAAPINWAIINGHKESGITTMFMDVGLDTGDMLIKETTLIGDNETAGEFHDRLKIVGADALIKTLYLISYDKLKRTPQDDSKSTYAPMLDKNTGRISWERSTIEIKNLVRGTNPWPGAFGILNNEKLKIWSVDIESQCFGIKRPGYVWKVDKEGIHVYTGDGGIIIKEVQAENSRKIDGYSYTLGHPIDIGSIFE